jgi:hypothetical protein
MLEMLIIILIMLCTPILGILFMQSGRKSASQARITTLETSHGSQINFKPLDDTPLYVPTRINFEGVYKAERAVWGHEWVHAGWPEPGSVDTAELASDPVQAKYETASPCTRCSMSAHTLFWADGERLCNYCMAAKVKRTASPTINYGALPFSAYGSKSGILGGGGGSTGISSVMYTCSVCSYTSDRRNDITPDCRVCMTRPCENCKQPTQSHKRYCDACVATQNLPDAEDWHKASECSKCKAAEDALMQSSTGICDCVAIQASGGGRSHAVDCAMFKTAQ